MLNVPSSIASKLDSPISLLPPHTEIIAALKQYFATVGSLFPCIDQETFFAAYSEHRKGQFKTARRSWLALLIMIICHANNTRTANSPSGQIEKRTESLFQIALAFAMPSLLFEANLEIGKKHIDERQRRLKLSDLGYSANALSHDMPPSKSPTIFSSVDISQSCSKSFHASRFSYN
jgi:hypothetical protein